MNPLSDNPDKTNEKVFEIPTQDIQEELMKLCGVLTVTVWKNKSFSVTGFLSYVGDDIWKVTCEGLYPKAWITFHILYVKKIMVGSIQLK